MKAEKEKKGGERPRRGHDRRPKAETRFMHVSTARASGGPGGLPMHMVGLATKAQSLHRPEHPETNNPSSQGQTALHVTTAKKRDSHLYLGVFYFQELSPRKEYRSMHQTTVTSSEGGWRGVGRDLAVCCMWDNSSFYFFMCFSNFP